MRRRADSPLEPAPGPNRRRHASRATFRWVVAAAVCLLAGPAWSLPVRLADIRDRPFGALDLRAEPYAVKPTPSTSPLLGGALSSTEPGTPQWLDLVLENEQSSFFLYEISNQTAQRHRLSQRSLLLLSRVLLDRPPEASPGEPGHDAQPVEWSSELARSATSRIDWQWSGGGFGGSPYSFSVGADAGDARSGGPASADPVLSKLVPLLEYLRENRSQILGLIAALLVLGAVGLRLIDRRVG